MTLMTPAIFKAYDVRGVYPTEINEKAVGKIARALAKHFLSKVKSKKSPRQNHSTRAELGTGRSKFDTGQAKVKIIVGRDGRLSSPSLYKVVLKVLEIRNSKLEILPVGIITTPMLYFLVNHLKAAGGIMITASHNPKEYNGLKVVGPKAKPINGTEIYELYKTLR